jgi:hypothetical protein
MKRIIAAVLFFVGCAPATVSSSGPTEPLNFDGASAEEQVVLIKSTIVEPNGCARVGADMERLREPAPADYWYFKGYCAKDTNPENACAYYVEFIKVARADARASSAKSYIEAQDAAAFPTCVVP